MVRRLMTGALAGVLALGLAGPVATATAGDGHDDRQQVVARATTLTDAQVAAVKAARQAYFEAVWPAFDAYDDAVDAAKAKMSRDVRTERRALAVAADAYWFVLKNGGAATAEKVAYDAALAAYRTAHANAKAAMNATIAAAKADLRAKVAQAQQTYVAAVTAAFPAGASIPASVLNPPGRALGWFDDHGDWKHLGTMLGLAGLLDLPAMGMGMGRDDRGRGSDDRHADDRGGARHGGRR